METSVIALTAAAVVLNYIGGVNVDNIQDVEWLTIAFFMAVRSRWWTYRNPELSSLGSCCHNRRTAGHQIYIDDVNTAMGISATVVILKRRL